MTKTRKRLNKNVIVQIYIYLLFFNMCNELKNIKSLGMAGVVAT